MCRHGEEILLTVPVPAELSADRSPRWAYKGIDKCIAPLVDALNNAEIYTASCCCGHGDELGHIWLQDGRILIVLPNQATKDDLADMVKRGAIT